MTIDDFANTADINSSAIEAKREKREAEVVAVVKKAHPQVFASVTNSKHNKKPTKENVQFHKLNTLKDAEAALIDYTNDSTDVGAIAVYTLAQIIVPLKTAKGMKKEYRTLYAPIQPGVEDQPGVEEIQ